VDWCPLDRDSPRTNGIQAFCQKGRCLTTKIAVVAAPAGKPSITFDEFVHGYWKEYKEASDVLRLPPDMMAKAVQYVNDVLRYAYGRLGGE
jgi:hypothetical protein